MNQTKHGYSRSRTPHNRRFNFCSVLCVQQHQSIVLLFQFVTRCLAILIVAMSFVALYISETSVSSSHWNSRRTPTPSSYRLASRNHADAKLLRPEVVQFLHRTASRRHYILLFQRLTTNGSFELYAVCLYYQL